MTPCGSNIGLLANLDEDELREHCQAFKFRKETRFTAEDEANLRTSFNLCSHTTKIGGFGQPKHEEQVMHKEKWCE